METIMRLSAYERAGLIAAAARNLGLGEAIVEKDLWVTYFLDYLFSRCLDLRPAVIRFDLR